MRSEWDTIWKAKCKMRLQDLTKNWKTIIKRSDSFENGHPSKKVLIKNLLHQEIGLFSFWRLNWNNVSVFFWWLHKKALKIADSRVWGILKSFIGGFWGKGLNFSVKISPTPTPSRENQSWSLLVLEKIKIILIYWYQNLAILFSFLKYFKWSGNHKLFSWWLTKNFLIPLQTEKKSWC